MEVGMGSICIGCVWVGDGFKVIGFDLEITDSDILDSLDSLICGNIGTGSSPSIE